MITTFPIVAPDVVSELRLSYSQAGIIAAAYMLGYGLFQLPVSYMGIAVGSGRVLLGAMVLMSVGALVPCVAGEFFGWVISRLLMGIAGAAVFPLGVHLLTLALSGSRLVKGLGVFVSGWGFGMTVAMLGAAPLLDTFGWRVVMLASGALGAIVIAGLFWALPPRNQGGDAVISPPNPAKLVRTLGTNHSLNLMSVMNVAGTSIVICVPAWLPLYVSSTFGIPAAETSASLAPIGLGVAIGAWMGGFLSIRFGWRSIVITGLLVSGLLVASIVLLSDSLAIFAVAILVCWIGMFFAAPVQSLFPFVIAQEWTALAAAYYNSIGFVGAFLASLMFGFLVDRFSDFTVGWLFFSAIPVLGIVAAVLLPISARVNSAPSL